MAGDDIRFHPAVAALYDPVQSYFERFQAPEHRAYLAAGLDGRVLEIGVGTGSMAPYYAEAFGSSAALHGIEPDPGMRTRARETFAENGLDVSLVSGRGERLPYADDAFDYVVECGVFCSVPEMEAMLAEIGRVLRPSGEFRFLDHVRSDGLVGRTQDALTPLWRRIGGNCHLNRRVRPVIEASDRLRVVDIDTHTVGYWPIREFVRGTAAGTSDV
ncbi:class I SAM-dependent methyltransferase [Halosimplex sp. J119]